MAKALEAIGGNQKTVDGIIRTAEKSVNAQGKTLNAVKANGNVVSKVQGERREDGARASIGEHQQGDSSVWDGSGWCGL